MARGFFCIFHALLFELNFFFDRRCPLTAQNKQKDNWQNLEHGMNI